MNERVQYVKTIRIPVRIKFKTKSGKVIQVKGIKIRAAREELLNPDGKDGRR